MVTVAPIRRVDWLLVTVVPMAVMLEPVQESVSAFSRLSDGVILASLLATLLAATSGCLSMWWLHRQIVQPIMSLAEAVRDISWERPVLPPMEMKGDEISELYASFMAAVRAARVANTEAEYRMTELSANNMRLAELNTELEAARVMTEQSCKTRHQFLVNMSHEIRTPINAILSMAQMLLLGDMVPVQRNQISILSRASNGLLNMLNDIIDISKIESGEIVLENYSFSLRDALQDIKNVFSPGAAAKGLMLSCDIGKDVPNIVMGDSYRLNQILSNLVSNSIKFTARGEIGIQVLLLSQTEGKSTLELTVRDTGIGIGPEVIRHIFEAFTPEGGSVTRRFGGTGLGLVICKELCEMMGGSISVFSQRGQGSAFRCVLTFGCPPVDVSPAVQAPDTYISMNADVLKAMAKRDAQVLLVDDNEINRQVGIMLLESLHVRVLTAEDGSAALDVLRSGAQVDLVLMDVYMPVMDGFAATAAIRCLPEPRTHVPVIALTAQTMSMERQQCLDVGMNGHMAKPIDIQILLDVLAKWLLTPTATGSEAPLLSPSAIELELPLIDIAHGLALLKTPASYARFLALFLQTHDREGVFTALLRQGALQDCAALAHRLMGSASSVALLRLAFSAERIEQAIHAGQPVEALLAQFEVIMTDTRSVVQSYIRSVNSETGPVSALPSRIEGAPRPVEIGPVSTLPKQN